LSWDVEFFDPIEPPRGRPLVTLRDAGHYNPTEAGLF
jgi:hypothetical protein